jgi:hypothetical protein
MLVHMTPGEVNGLQSLAMAHGGSLTINPDTGLPEAGILSKLLPTVLGFALGPAGMGIKIGSLSSAASAGLISGAVGTLTSGSLSKGIMAGLGAYGGASLGGALKGVGGSTVPIDFGAGAGENLGAGTYFKPSLANTVSKAAPNMTPGTPGSQIFGTPSAVGFGVPTPEAKPFAANLDRSVKPLDVKVSAPDLSTGGNMRAPGGIFGENMRAAGRGAVKALEDPFGFAKENYMPIAAIVASMSGGDDYRMPGEEKGKGLEKYRYVYDRTPVGVPAMSSAERNYFPGARYESTGERYAASGGLMALANGGTVEEMSRLNTIGANTGYPMANQMSSTYASPAERPISENIIRPQGDANVDPYTGAERFADGGYTRYTGTTPLDPKKDDFYYVPGSMGGGGYYMVRDSGRGGAGKDDSSVDFFDPNYYNPKTGTYGYQSGSATAQKAGPSAADQKKLLVNNLFNQYLGRDPDQRALDFYSSRDEETIKKDIFGSKEYKESLTQPVRSGVIKSAYKDILGRDPDESGLQAYGAAGMTPDQIRQNLLGSQEYKNILAAKEAAAKEATYATAEQTADAYERIMGRQPDVAGLKYYTKTNRMTPEEMEKSLRESDEYFYNLTKPFVPEIRYGANGIATIDEAPRYDPTQYGFSPSQTNARNEIKGMYQNQLGRIADPRGEQYWADTIGADNQLSQNDMARFQLEADKEIQARQAGYAMGGGISDLGGYSDGGRLLKGPGDGVSDSIPAVIGQRQPARLADGEFVIPARIVSELGNGSTDAGARKLYAMMDRVQKARRKTTGKSRVAANTKAEKYLPA